MNFKRTWDGKNGCTPIYKKEDSACTWIEIDMLKLDKGEEFSVRVHGDGGEGYIHADALLLKQK